MAELGFVARALLVQWAARALNAAGLGGYGGKYRGELRLAWTCVAHDGTVVCVVGGSVVSH